MDYTKSKRCYNSYADIPNLNSIHSSKEYLVNSLCVLGTLLGGLDTIKNKRDKDYSLREFVFSWEAQMINSNLKNNIR